MLLAIASGSLLSLPLAGTIIDRIGSRRTVSAMALISNAALAVIAVGYTIGIAPVVVGLFAFGFAAGAWDVAMNVQAALVERRIGRSIMPRFHAGFSVGTVAGALLGAGMVIVHVPVTAHLSIVAIGDRADRPARGAPLPRRSRPARSDAADADGRRSRPPDARATRSPAGPSRARC